LCVFKLIGLICSTIKGKFQTLQMVGLIDRKNINTICTMKVLLDIQDNKALHLLEVLKGLSYVKTTTISDEKALLIGEIKEAVEELSLIRQGKLKGIPAKQLLDEL
jgi:hypothetical protein